MEKCEIETLVRYRDASSEAISRRLRALRMTVNTNQAEFARSINLTKTTYNSQEVKGAPSKEVLDFFYFQHEVGPNFILYGDCRRVPSETLFAVATVLRADD